MAGLGPFWMLAGLCDPGVDRAELAELGGPDVAATGELIGELVAAR